MGKIKNQQKIIQLKSFSGFNPLIYPNLHLATSDIPKIDAAGLTSMFTDAKFWNWSIATIWW